MAAPGALFTRRQSGAPAGKDPSGLDVVYVSDDGRDVQYMGAYYDAEYKAMVFETTHLSLYAIADTAIQPITSNLVSVEIAEAPTKTEYSVGDRFDPTGLVLTLTYADSTIYTYTYEKHEPAFGFSPGLDKALKSTDKSVTVTYQGLSAEQEITVEHHGTDDSSLVIVAAAIAVIVAAAIAIWLIRR